MKPAVETAKILFLVATAIGVWLIRADTNSRHDEEQRDAQRAKDILREFYLQKLDFEVKRDSWILKNQPDLLGKQHLAEWKKLVAIFVKTKDIEPQVAKLKSLRSEHQDLTWKHPTWSFMIEYTPDVKTATGED